MQLLYAPFGNARSQQQVAVTCSWVFFRTHNAGAVLLYLLDQPVDPPGEIVLVVDRNLHCQLLQ